MSESGWRAFFVAAAAFNFAVGLSILVAPEAMLTILDLPVPGDLFFRRLTGLLVVCLGIAYALAARDPERNRAIVWTGAIGKTGAVLLFGQAWLQGTIPFPVFAVSLGDLAFVAGFLLFLLTKRSAA